MNVYSNWIFCIFKCLNLELGFLKLKNEIANYCFIYVSGKMNLY